MYASLLIPSLSLGSWLMWWEPKLVANNVMSTVNLNV